MHPEEPAVAGAAERLASKFGEAPRVAMVLGSGLGPVADQLVDFVDAPFEDLGLPGSTVPGHAGKIRVGTFGGERVAVVRGRVHLYEGLGANTVVRYVRALHRWGVQNLLLTCSVGGIAAGLEPGSLVLVNDHINMQHDNPLVGPAFGTRFPDLGSAYDPQMRYALTEEARSQGIPLPNGVLACMQGPAYETPAEVKMLDHVGADVVGMSTVPEVLAAAAIGLRAAVVAVVSNRAAGLTDSVLTHDEVTETAAVVSVRLAALIEGALGEF